MKKITMVLLLISFVSCQITERMYLSESGMVKQESEIDFSAMMSIVFTPEKIDSMRLVGEFPIDTILSIADSGLSPVSNEGTSAAENEFTKSFDKTKVRMIMNESGGKFIIFNDEMSVKDFNSYQKKIQEAYKKFEANDPESASSFAQSGYNTILEYKYNDKEFEKISLTKQMNLDDLATDSSGFSMKDMLSLYTYKIEYHFPKAVKSTTLKDAQISEDGKTITADIPMGDLLENPQNYNFKVEFE